MRFRRPFYWQAGIGRKWELARSTQAARARLCELDGNEFYVLTSALSFPLPINLVLGLGMKTLLGRCDAFVVSIGLLTSILKTMDKAENREYCHAMTPKRRLIG